MGFRCADRRFFVALFPDGGGAESGVGCRCLMTVFAGMRLSGQGGSETRLVAVLSMQCGFRASEPIANRVKISVAKRCFSSNFRQKSVLFLKKTCFSAKNTFEI